GTRDRRRRRGRGVPAAGRAHDRQGIERAALSGAQRDHGGEKEAARGQTHRARPRSARDSLSHAAPRATGGQDRRRGRRGGARAGAAAARRGGGAVSNVVFAASATGKDLAPRVAARLGRPLVQDVTDLSVIGGAVVAIRPVYAGKALLKVRVAGSPAVLSLRPNVFTPVQRPKAGAQESASVAGSAGRVVVTQIKPAPAGTLDVAEAPIIVSGGRGLKEPANFQMLGELAGAFGGTG